MDIIAKIRNYLKSHSLRKIWYRIALMLSSLAVFVTTYFLMLPALTLADATTKITQLGNGINNAINYDNDGNIKINVNNIYRIDAYLGPNADANTKQAYLNSSNNNTILVKMGSNKNLSSYFGNISLEGFIGVRIECYKVSQYSNTKTNAAHEYYCVQQVYGTANAGDGTYSTDSTKIKGMAYKTDNGFIFLIKKSFVYNPTAVGTYSNLKTTMYIPQAGYDSNNPKAGFNPAANNISWYNDVYYEPGEDCLVDFNQEPLVQYVKKMTMNGNSHFSSWNGTDAQMNLGIYSPKDGPKGYLGPAHPDYDKQHGLGFITFSLEQNQQNAANAGELPGDVPQENLAKINTKLFDYNQYINMTDENKKVTNSSDKSYIRKIAPFFSFRYTNLMYYGSTNNRYMPQNFWWHDYQSCICDIESDGTCDATTVNYKVGTTSFLHRPWPEKSGANYKPFDVDGFGEGHSTVEYNLVDGYPVLDFTRNANYLKFGSSSLSDYTVSSSSRFFPTLNTFSGKKASGNYGLSPDDRSLSYLFGGTVDHAVTTYLPTNSILQYDESESRYYYDSSKNAVDYDSVNKIFRVRGYVESGESGAFEQIQTFDFLPFNYASGYVIGTEYSGIAKNVDGKIIQTDCKLKEKSFNDCAILQDVQYRFGSADPYEFKQAVYDQGESTVRYNNIDYWFGMTMEFNFTQGKDGKVILKDENGAALLNDEDVSQTKDMIFTFSGDDDVWVFIDNVLVLDLGGTHERAKGTINFSTGKIEQFMAKYESAADSKNKAPNDTRVYETSLIECFERANVVTISSDGSAPNGWKLISNGNGEQGYILDDYSVHNLKFFYLERGGVVANNSIEFYLNTFEDNSLLIEKKVEPSNDPDLNIIRETQEFEFRVLKVNDNGTITNESVLPNGTEYIVQQNGKTVATKIVENDKIKLKAGQIAVVNEMLTKTNPGVTNDALKTPRKFVVQELLPNNQVFQYQGVSVNGKNVTNSKQVYSTETGYSCTVLDSGVQNHTKFTNTVNKEKLHSIEIEKELVPFDNISDFGLGITANTKFNIAVTVGGENIPAGTQYYVYTLDSNGNVSSTYDTKEVEEDPDGNSIIKIKDGQRAVIKGLLDGTKFTVKELFDADTVGYTIDYTYEKSGTGTVTTDANGVSGTLSSNNSTNAYVRVKVKNSRKGITTSIDLSKKFENSKQITGSNTFKFNIVIEEVTSGKPDSALSSNNVNNATFTPIFNGSPITNDTQTESFNLSFVDNVESGKSNTYYYRIKEVVDNPISIITYDTSVYILTVTVSEKTDGGLSVTKSLKKFESENSSSGTTQSSADTITFQNTLELYSLPTTGANIFLNARPFALLGFAMVVSLAIVVLVCIRKRKNGII